jgi:cytochrome c oxidase subunit II
MAIFGLDMFFYAIIVGLVVYSLVVFKRKDGVRTPYITHNLFLELLWSVLPTFIVIGVFFWGAAGFLDSTVAPDGAMEISVTARKWSWAFEYPDGSKYVNEIHIPINKPVKFTITSDDVLHGFYLRDFRVEHGAIPQRYEMLWFTPTVAGKHVIECTQYCGKDHSKMIGYVTVEDQAAYDKWLVEGPPEWDELLKTNPAELGKRTYENKGCNSCHSVDGSKVQNGGPTWKGMWGRTEKFEDGGTVVVDEKYVRESIEYPAKHVVQGYSNIMPSFGDGLIREKELKGLLAYMQSLK